MFFVTVKFKFCRPYDDRDKRKTRKEKIPLGGGAFSPGKLTCHPDNFGPNSMYQTVHYGGGRWEKQKQLAKAEEEKLDLRKVVVDTDKMRILWHSRPELRADDARLLGIDFERRLPPIEIRDKYNDTKEVKSVEKPPLSIHIDEYLEETPIKQFQCRLRENDSEAPYDVKSNTYVPRLPDEDIIAQFENLAKLRFGVQYRPLKSILCTNLSRIV